MGRASAMPSGRIRLRVGNPPPGTPDDCRRPAGAGPLGCRVMDPVLLHADGTDCRHDGPPAATAGDPGGPCCAAGIPVTHVRVGAQILTIAEAQAAFAELTAALGEMFAVLAGNVREMAAAFSRAMSATMNGSSH